MMQDLVIQVCKCVQGVVGWCRIWLYKSVNVCRKWLDDAGFGYRSL